MRIDVDPHPWFDIGDDESIPYEQKLVEYRRLADEHFQADVYAEFCSSALPHLDDPRDELAWLYGRLRRDDLRSLPAWG